MASVVLVNTPNLPLAFALGISYSTLKMEMSFPKRRLTFNVLHGVIS
jgi:hypothetical protein